MIKSLIILIFSTGILSAQIYVDTVVFSHSAFIESEHGIVLSYYNLNSSDYKDISINNKDSIFNKYAPLEYELYFNHNPLEDHYLNIGNINYEFDPSLPFYRVEAKELSNGIRFISKNDFWTKGGVVLEVDLLYENNDCYKVIISEKNIVNVWVPGKVPAIHEMVLKYKNYYNEELRIRFVIDH